ncbi:Hyaluronan / mRNA binding family protein [Theileria parva strain Muguga]|uniref:Hyaluronan/mRNA-binding protein domain-containing protein n=1 Tax=Theileria parva TaxID=5875 RepID=Q4N214_THEPA|nr:Hyaluronan / mRNA binding family protein [Theileria parva strain Muguga]EAN31915.1 Hyaluronan / mRNA binding family protein [Theileria parva strain Muguga]|eukprot:XP_764198.1 hypothetical protein [Theileria parva strain Muguga]
MAANRVTYNVGTSNKFAAFYDDTDPEKLTRNSCAGSTKFFPASKGQIPEELYDVTVNSVQLNSHPVNTNTTPVVQMNSPSTVNSLNTVVSTVNSVSSVNANSAVSNAPVYTDDNIFDTRAKGRRPSRRFRGNPNGPRRFDRVSGTGRGRELKKQGEGGHNWGSVSKLSNEPLEDDQLNESLNNLTLNGNNNSKGGDTKVHKDEEKSKSKRDDKKKSDMMDYESYKLLQQSKRTNLPTFTVNDDVKVSTDQELQNDGYVKYVKKVEDNKLVEKVKVINSHANSNPLNVLPNHPSSFRDRKSSKPKQKLTKSGGRIRVKAPDLADLKLFPCLDLKS